MIIVSQDKNSIINFNNISFIEIEKTDDKYELYFETNDMRGEIGVYATEDRAEEVLREMIIVINHKGEVYQMPKE